MKKYIVCLVVFGFVLVQARSAGLPEKLRVLSVDLGSARVEMPGTPGSELSQELRRMMETAEVDIICIQGALDWENCERVCKLKPGFQVLTCSAFSTTPQVAVLSRERALLSWVEEIGKGNGYALAIVQAGNKKLALFSVASDRATAPTDAGPTEAILGEVKKLQKFPQNRPDSFLVAGSGLIKTSSLLDGGFQTVSCEPRPANGGSEYWVLNAGFLTRPRSLSLPGARSQMAICDFDTASTFSSKFAYHTPLLFPGESPTPVVEKVATVVKPQTKIWPFAIGGSVLLLLALLIIRNKPAPQMALVRVNGSEGLAPRIAADETVRHGLMNWLKSAFMQRLLSQRQQLLSNEEEATRRTMVIEEKLTTLQTALQERIAGYETRIQRLEQELTAATVENRDLIRSQIELLKEKVTRAKEEQSVRRN